MWSSATTIRGKKVLKSDYQKLKSLFVNILGVETLNLQLIYNELLMLEKSTPTVASVKEQLFAFKAHLHTISCYKEITPDSLRKLKVFPVMDPDTTEKIQFCDGYTEFAIADREHLGDNFRPLIKTLGLTFDEIHALKPLMNWLGLEESYLSRMVRETSQVGDGGHVLNHSLNRDIKTKAYGLCR